MNIIGNRLHSIRKLLGIGLNETIKVVVNDIEYPVEIVDGAGEFNVSGLESGEYAALGIFESQNYKLAYATETFTVLETGAELSVSIDDATYGDDVVINAVLTDKDGNGLNGIVKVRIGEDEYFVPVIDGEGSLVVSGLTARDYAYTAEFMGDNIYAPVSQEEKTFKVKQAQSNIVITAPGEIVYGNELTVGTELTSDGELIAGDVVVVVKDAAGNVVSDLSKLDAGQYTINAAFAGDDNYSGSEATSTVVVVPASSIVAVGTNSVIKDGKTQVISVVVDPEVEGTVKVIVTGEGYTFEQTYDVSELASPIELTGLAVGEYNVEVVFTPSANYESSTADAGFTVVPKDATVITITAPSEITYGDALLIGTELTSNGQVISGDVVLVVKDAAGNVVSDFSKLPIGKYTIVATYSGSDEYVGTDSSATVVVRAAATSVVVSPIEEINMGETQRITVTVGPENADGTVKVIVTREGYSFIREYAVSELTEPITLDDLSEGTYSIDVIFNAGENYVSSTASAGFTVKSTDVSAKVNATFINFGENVTVTIVGMPEDVPVSDLNITDNGKEIAVTLNGNEFVYAPAESGDHVIAINYNGTAYDKFYAETSFTVAPVFSKAWPKRVARSFDICSARTHGAELTKALASLSDRPSHFVTTRATDNAASPFSASFTSHRLLSGTDGLPFSFSTLVFGS